MERIKMPTAKAKVPLLDYEKKPLGLNDQYPVGYLAGCTTREAILHDPKTVYHDQISGKVILKGDSIHLLCQLVNNKGEKIVASGKKGF